MRCVVDRYLSDDPQPGIVLIRITDINGRDWFFIEKQAMVVSGSVEYLTWESEFPRPAQMRCTVLVRYRDSKNRDVVRIDVSAPDHIESLEGETQFEVLAQDVFESAS